MRLSSIATVGGTLIAAAGLSVLTAYFSSILIERASKSAVLYELELAGLPWAEVDTNGLNVFLIGTAPDEATRFRALSTAGKAVDAARVIDNMLVEESKSIVAPSFSIEMLRNDSGVSVIGLIPASTDRDALVAQFQDIAGDQEVSDLLESANYPAPESWDAAVRFAVNALENLPRSQISVDEGSVAIKAQTESADSKRSLESDLARRKPQTVTLALDLSAPRPVISPFTLRFVMDEDRPHFDACAADTEEARARILAAASAAGVSGNIDCTLGLGVPSRRWAEASELAITKLAALGGGTVTLSNADIALLAPEGTDPALFDRVVGELEAGLPPVFALNAVLPKVPDQNDQGPAEFSATLSPEGEVQLRGRLPNEVARITVDGFARAAFGSDVVYMAARTDDSLPRGWQVRALAAIEALSKLSNGAVSFTPDSFDVSGKTGNKDARSDIAQMLTTKLGDTANYDLKITYEEKLDPILALPTPDECEAQISVIIGDRKIMFEPGSTTPDASTRDILDELAELLKTCGDIPLEIGGHTDSQGREEMNQDLSRARAQAILDGLRDRLVPTRSYTVVGYGETTPVADNDTEEGREANRRIEFKLLRPEPVADTESTLDSVAEPGTAKENSAEGQSDG